MTEEDAAVLRPIHGKFVKLANGGEVFLGLVKDGSVEDGYFVKFQNVKGEVHKFALSREAFEALLALKPHVDLLQYELVVWTEVRAEFKETPPELEMTREEWLALRCEYDEMAIAAPPEDRLKKCKEFINNHPGYNEACQKYERE